MMGSASTPTSSRPHQASEQRARHLTEQAQVRLVDLPPDIAAAVNARNDEILEQLQARLAALAGAPAALGQLETAEAELIAVSTTIGSIQNDLAQIPPDQRIPLAEAQAALHQAEQDLKQAQELRDTLRDEHNRLPKGPAATRSAGHAACSPPPALPDRPPPGNPARAEPNSKPGSSPTPPHMELLRFART